MYSIRIRNDNYTTRGKTPTVKNDKVTRGKTILEQLGSTRFLSYLFPTKKSAGSLNTCKNLADMRCSNISFLYIENEYSQHYTNMICNIDVDLLK